ncbi:hypothetical protein ATCC90586_006846 [Pythium insidiosum]|nr:hypothetical protein ATCC90586_006846 [Pythium insidiosum]
MHRSMWPKLWPHAPSPVSVVQFRGQRVHVKRDDVFHLAGNKLRKLFWFLQQDESFFSDKHLISFGGTQSNAMLAIAQVAHETKTPFTYFSRALECSDPLEARLAEGNLAHALALGMRHVQLSDVEYQVLAETRETTALSVKYCRRHEIPLFIPQGAAFRHAEHGVSVLAQELNSYCSTWTMNSSALPEQPTREHRRFSIVLPCGTGTTAFYLAQHLSPDIQLFAVPCVGDADYLKQQWADLAERHSPATSTTAIEYPLILHPSRKARFGRLDWGQLALYREVLASTGIEVDLLYGALAWQTMMEPQNLAMITDASAPRELLYIHTGGVSGNATMLASDIMSYRELRNLTEMMRALGYPRPISMENFRKPNFELVSDLLYWMVKKYDPTSSLTEEIDTEEDRVQFITMVATEVLVKARIRLNPKKLYAADGFAVKELIKLARVLYEASRIDISKLDPAQDDDDDDVSVKSLLGSRVKDPKATRQLSSDITQIGAKLYDLLDAELDVRELRTQALRFLDALSNNSDNSVEQKYLERSLREILQTTQETVEMTERQCVELEAEEKALAAKIKKAQTDLERSEKRLKSLQHVRPAFMDEYEKLEKELERQYAIYCERFRNLDYLQRELDLHNAREMKKLAENDRSLKRLQKKFREDELAILRGEQEEQIDGALLEPSNNNGGSSSGKSKGGKAAAGGNQARKTSVNGSNQKAAAAGKAAAGASAAAGTAKKPANKRNDNESASDADSGSGSGSEDDEDDEDATSDESDEGSGRRGAGTSGARTGGGGNGAAASGGGGEASDSDEVSLADSGELIDNDDESGSEATDGSGSDGGSQQSGSETNSDSDQDF